MITEEPGKLKSTRPKVSSKFFISQIFYVTLLNFCG